MTTEYQQVILDFIEHEESYSDPVVLPDGTFVCILQFLFTSAIISGVNVNGGYADRWCFHDQAVARAALKEWVANIDTMSEPDGWHRHPETGRRVGETFCEVYL